MSLRIKDSMAGSVSGSVTGNAGTATKLQTARTINGTNFDGSANITTANWGTARTITVGSTGKSVNGSANVSWSLSEIGAAAASHTHNYAGSSSAGGAATSALTCTGNAATATKLATARTISATGHATGSVSFDGSANASLALTLANSGVTAASYGPTGNSSPASGGTFTVPQVTVDAKGRVTSAATRTITLPKASSTEYFYSTTAPASAKENDIWYKMEVSTSDTVTHTFSYKNSAQTFTAPIDGVYKIVCYGARGGYRNSSSTYAGKGGLVSGNVTLKQGDTLYIYTGQNGNISSTDSYSFNGGGKGVASYQYGGGATDVRLVGGNWDNEASLLSRIIVAGGGGSCGGTSKQGGNSDTAATSGYGTGGHAGSQTAGGTGSTSNTSTQGLFGKGGHGINASSGYGGAGGGGWYGGAGTYPDSSGDDDKGGGGGSNYVYTSTSTKPSGYTPDARFQFTNTSITKTNSVSDGKVEIYSAVSKISGTYVYREGKWVATSTAIDLTKDTYSGLSTTNKTIIGSINEVFQNVSNGKSSIAQAVTSMGVSASASDSFSSLASKIKSIPLKKYDSGDKLKKGVNFYFDWGSIVKETASSSMNFSGTVRKRSKNYIFTTDDFWNYNFYRYNSSTNSYEKAGTASDSSISYLVDGYYMRYGTVYSIDTGAQISLPSMEVPPTATGFTFSTSALLEDDNGFIYLVYIGNGTESYQGMPVKYCYYEVYFLMGGGSGFSKITNGQVVCFDDIDDSNAISTDGNYLAISNGSVFLYINISTGYSSGYSIPPGPLFCVMNGHAIVSNPSMTQIDVISLSTETIVASYQLSSGAYWDSSYTPIAYDNSIFVPVLSSGTLSKLLELDFTSDANGIKTHNCSHSGVAGNVQLHGSYPRFTGFYLSPDYNTITLI